MPKVNKVGQFRKAASATRKTPRKAAAAVESPTATTTTTDKSNVQQQQQHQQPSDLLPPPAIHIQDGTLLSRGQKKRLAKREQYLKRERMVLSSLKLKKADEQKKRIDGLDAMKDALLETMREGKARASSERRSNNQDNDDDDNDLLHTQQQQPRSSMLKTNKSRKKLVEKETAQLGLVLEHPAFQADPFGAIRDHLLNTTANDAALQKRQEIQHNKERKAKDERKKAIKKEQGALAVKGRRHSSKHRARPTRSRGGR